MDAGRGWFSIALRLRRGSRSSRTFARRRDHDQLQLAQSADGVEEFENAAAKCMLKTKMEARTTRKEGERERKPNLVEILIFLNLFGFVDANSRVEVESGLIERRKQPVDARTGEEKRRVSCAGFDQPPPCPPSSRPSLPARAARVCTDLRKSSCSSLLDLLSPSWVLSRILSTTSLICSLAAGWMELSAQKVR